MALAMLGGCGTSPTNSVKTRDAGNVDDARSEVRREVGSDAGDGGFDSRADDQRREAAGGGDVSSSIDATKEQTAFDSGQGETDSGQCGTLVNSASPVNATAVSSFSHNFQGGTIVDGTYDLVRVEETISSAPAKFWRTFQISNLGTKFEWVVQMSAFHRSTTSPAI